MNKKELRSAINGALKNTTPEQRQAWSYDFCNEILSDERISKAKVIMAFYPLDIELDISPLLDKFINDGKLVLLPVVVNATDLQLRKYTNKNSLVEGDFKIQIPKGEEFTSYDIIEAVLVPGVAFDKNGHRLSRGKGYYDRFLKKLNNAYTRAVYFPLQLVDNVPVDQHDVIIDYV